LRFFGETPFYYLKIPSSMNIPPLVINADDLQETDESRRVRNEWGLRRPCFGLRQEAAEKVAMPTSGEIRLDVPRNVMVCIPECDCDLFKTDAGVFVTSTARFKGLIAETVISNDIVRVTGRCEVGRLATVAYLAAPRAFILPLEGRNLDLLALGPELIRRDADNSGDAESLLSENGTPANFMLGEGRVVFFDPEPSPQSVIIVRQWAVARTAVVEGKGGPGTVYFGVPRGIKNLAAGMLYYTRGPHDAPELNLPKNFSTQISQERHLERRDLIVKLIANDNPKITSHRPKRGWAP
jgi:hypothetical protein